MASEGVPVGQIAVEASVDATIQKEEKRILQDRSDDVSRSHLVLLVIVRMAMTRMMMMMMMMLL